MCSSESESGQYMGKTWTYGVAQNPHAYRYWGSRGVLVASTADRLFKSNS